MGILVPDTLRDDRRNFGDPDQLIPTKEFAGLKADIYMSRKERKASQSRYRKMRNKAKGEMSDESADDKYPAVSPKGP